MKVRIHIKEHTNAVAPVSGFEKSLATQQPLNCLQKHAFAPATQASVGRTGSTIISNGSAAKHSHPLLLPMLALKSITS